ncbi:MAG TPA: hypothetical protein VGQ02_11575 [Candidatus Limnocylindrales bacterium]|jgi:hypothetical protein|nr:hypothetical protein [Candidatus Limnocylindrales bacterium]
MGYQRVAKGATAWTHRWAESWPVSPRRLAIAATLGIVIGIAASTAMIWPEIVNQAGEDYRFFVGAARRWLDTGLFYLPHQLDGPYEAMTAVDVLYPPVALWLFVPFTVLPAPLWWLIPVGIVVVHVVLARPSWPSWPLIALLCWFPRSESMIIWGSTGMWVTALVALGLRFPGVAPFVLLKPTFAPFALIGIRDRAWWLGLGVFVIACLALLPLWPDFVTALRNNVGPWPPGALYSLPDYALVVVPIAAWLARTDRR